VLYRSSVSWVEQSSPQLAWAEPLESARTRTMLRIIFKWWSGWRLEGTGKRGGGALDNRQHYMLVTKQLKHSAVDEHVPWYCSASDKSTPEQSQYNNKVRQFRAVYEFVVVHQRCGEHLAHP